MVPLSDDLRQLYLDVILDHNRAPRNYGKIVNPTHTAEGYNPLCGDIIHLYLSINEHDIIEAARFEANGCAISRASASLMTEEVVGRSVDHAHTLFKQFHNALTVASPSTYDTTQIGKLIVLLGVREFPTRVKCATLAWHTLEQALHGGGQTTTEK